MDTSPLPSSIADLDAGDIPRKDDGKIREVEFMGYKIYAGGNAYSNESLVRNHPHKSCFWLHAWKKKGPHIIVCFEGKDPPPESVFRRAAYLAVLISPEDPHPSVNVAPLTDVYKENEEEVGKWRTWRKEKIQL